MCRFIESIQLNNGVFKRLELHQERVRLALKDYYPGVKAFDLVESLHTTTFPVTKIYKCRVLYDSVIRKIEYIPYTQRKINSLKLVETDMESTHYKLEDRSLYNAAFALRGECDEIILVKNGLLTDTSFTNIALYDGIQWYTPRSPLIYGVNRAELIQQGVLTEKDINASDLVNFTRVSLFNAMNEFGSIELDISAIRQ
ncbi:MAG: aminotransferase class IV [Paludibacter sp.]|nr:aminotransferase class IV [Paludibacter sp.]